MRIRLKISSQGRAKHKIQGGCEGVQTHAAYTDVVHRRRNA